MEPKNGTYHGTYKIRSVGKGEMGIHMPVTITGEFAIYEDFTGVVTLVPMGKRVVRG
jgi:hypothetical protein